MDTHVLLKSKISPTTYCKDSTVKSNDSLNKDKNVKFCVIEQKYVADTDSTKINRPGYNHTYVLNDFLTADCSCKKKLFWKNSYRTL